MTGKQNMFLWRGKSWQQTIQLVNGMIISWFLYFFHPFCGTHLTTLINIPPLRQGKDWLVKIGHLLSQAWSSHFNSESSKMPSPPPGPGQVIWPCASCLPHLYPRGLVWLLDWKEVPGLTCTWLNPHPGAVPGTQDVLSKCLLDECLNEWANRHRAPGQLLILGDEARRTNGLRSRGPLNTVWENIDFFVQGLGQGFSSPGALQNHWDFNNSHAFLPPSFSLFQDDLRASESEHLPHISYLQILTDWFLASQEVHKIYTINIWWK